MKILLISQYAKELLNDTLPLDPILHIHYCNYHKMIYRTLLKLGHIVTVTDGMDNEQLVSLTLKNDIIFPIRSYYKYPNGDIFVRLLCQKYDKKLIGGSSFSRFYESDKIIGKLLSDKLKIKTPQYALPFQISELPFDEPYILKPRFTGSSLNLSDDNIFWDKTKLITAVKALQHPECFYVEEYIKGITATIGCLTGLDQDIIMGEPYSLISTTHEVITYEDKRNGGCIRGPIKDLQVRKQLSEYCELIFKAIQPCQIARFDFMLSEEKELYFLEINESPNLSITGGFVQLLLEKHFKTYDNFINHLLKTAISSNK